MHRLVRLLAVFLLAFGLVASAATTTEYEVKAAFLYNFAKFIQWPAADKAPGGINLCLLGQNPFGRALDALEGKSVQGKPLHVRHLSGPDEIAGCQMLFISDSEAAQVPRVLEELKNLQGVLSVSDIRGFADAGGMIELFIKSNRVRFAVNLGAATDAGLTVSSKLLRLATRVDGDPAP